MGNNKEDYTGCLVTVGIFSAVIAGVLLCNEAVKEVGKEYKKDPSNIIIPLLVIAGICWVIYKIKNSS